MSIDLERFPWSDSANRMLTYVTKGWYDKSYVGKWIYEVMGRELDLATVHIEELPYQMFIDTATWGLKYHEIKYGACVPWTEFNQKMLFRKNSDNTECVNKNKSINIPKGSQENS